MGDIRSIPYYKNEALNFEAVSLAYENDKFRFYVILPTEDSDVWALTQVLDATELRRIFEESEKNEVDVSLRIPKLKFNWNMGITEVLETLGLETTFEQANLSKMFEQTVQVSQVIHATTIEVYELGTETTAATVVSLLGTAFINPNSTVEFIVNRPFMFMIYDIKDQTVLLNGIVNKPET